MKDTHFNPNPVFRSFEYLGLYALTASCNRVKPSKLVAYDVFHGRSAERMGWQNRADMK